MAAKAGTSLRGAQWQQGRMSPRVWRRDRQGDGGNGAARAGVGGGDTVRVDTDNGKRVAASGSDASRVRGGSGRVTAAWHQQKSSTYHKERNESPCFSRSLPAHSSAQAGYSEHRQRQPESRKRPGTRSGTGSGQRKSGDGHRGGGDASRRHGQC